MNAVVIRGLRGMRRALLALDAQLVDLPLLVSWLQREKRHAAEVAAIHREIDALEPRARRWVTRHAVAEA